MGAGRAGEIDGSFKPLLSPFSWSSLHTINILFLVPRAGRRDEQAPGRVADLEGMKCVCFEGQNPSPCQVTEKGSDC